MLPFLLLLCLTGKTQLNSITVASPTSGMNYGSVSYYDPSKVGQRKATALNYADIDGSPFWSDEWRPAFLFLSGNSIVKLKSVKLNLYTSDVLYVDDQGVEMEAIPGQVVRILFPDEKDSTKTLAVFNAFRDEKMTNGFSYYRVIADGKWKFVELKKALVRSVPGNVMSAKKVESSFYTESSYAIVATNDISPLKSLGYTNIVGVMHIDKSADQWLKESKNNLKRESEVIAFMNYYNLK